MLELLRLTVRQVASTIDHALLQPTQTDAQIAEGLAMCRRLQVAAACVKPYSVPQAAEALAGSVVKVCSVVGFPHGNNQTRIKQAETALALAEGATEIDMVVNNGKVLGGDWAWVRADIVALQDTCRSHGAILKVIFENDFLPEAAIIRLCEVCSEVGVAFVKTSTGYGFVRQASGEYSYRGATVAHLRLMRQHCPPQVQIKAAGGIRTFAEAQAALNAGATRLGASSTEGILTGALAAGLPPGEGYAAAELLGLPGAVLPAGY